MIKIGKNIPEIKVVHVKNILCCYDEDLQELINYSPFQTNSPQSTPILFNLCALRMKESSAMASHVEVETIEYQFRENSTLMMFLHL